MGRDLRRMPMNFDWPIDRGPWWGLVLEPIECQRCQGGSEDCADCEGEGHVYPRVEPPGFEASLNEGEEDARDDGDYPYGWQVWENVSEGSPISPVCATARELAEWLSRYATGLDEGRSVEVWLEFMRQGSAPSFVLSRAAGLEAGVDAIARHRAATDA